MSINFVDDVIAYSHIPRVFPLSISSFPGGLPGASYNSMVCSLLFSIHLAFEDAL